MWKMTDLYGGILCQKLSKLFSYLLILASAKMTTEQNAECRMPKSLIKMSNDVIKKFYVAYCRTTKCLQLGDFLQLSEFISIMKE